MWRVIFMTDRNAVLVDENKKTFKTCFLRSQDYEDIVNEAFKNGQEITFADYSEKVEISSLYGEQKEDSNFIKSDNYINVVKSWYKT